MKLKANQRQNLFWRTTYKERENRMKTRLGEKIDWFRKLPGKDQDIIYGYLESFKTYDLWDWIIELLPKKDLVQILESNREDQE